MRFVAFAGLLVLLALLAALLYITLPAEQRSGRIVARRQRVEREDPVYGFHGSFLGVLRPVFELCFEPDEGGGPVWLPCTQHAYHSVHEGAACCLVIRGSLIRKILPDK
ncbi:hypothetical protein AGATL06_16890 [Agathobaculum sp. TL06]